MSRVPNVHPKRYDLGVFLKERFGNVESPLRGGELHGDHGRVEVKDLVMQLEMNAALR